MFGKEICDIDKILLFALIIRKLLYYNRNSDKNLVLFQVTYTQWVEVIVLGGWVSILILFLCSVFLPCYFFYITDAHFKFLHCITNIVSDNYGLQNLFLICTIFYSPVSMCCIHIYTICRGNLFLRVWPGTYLHMSKHMLIKASGSYYETMKQVIAIQLQHLNFIFTEARLLNVFKVT